MSLSQLTNSQLGWGFHTLRGGFDRGDLRLYPRVVGVVEKMKTKNTGTTPYPPRVWRDLDDVPRGNSQRALAP